MDVRWTALKQGVLIMVDGVMGQRGEQAHPLQAHRRLDDGPVTERAPVDELRIERDGRPAPPPRMRQSAFVLGLVVLTLLAAGMRWYALAEPSLWIDELFTVRSSIMVAQGDVSARTLAYVPSLVGLWLGGIDAAALNPDGYAAWRAAGITEQLVRIPTFALGVLSVPVLGWMSRRMIGPRAALVLTLLLAVSTWHLWMSQTARFYPQQFLFYNMCLLFYYDATRRGSRRAMVGAGVCLVLAFATQLTSLLIVGIFALDWVVNRLRGEPIRLDRTSAAILAGAVGVCAAIVGAHYLTEPTSYTRFEGSHQSALALLLGVPFMVGVTMVVVSGLTALYLGRARPALATFLVLGALAPLATFVVLALADFDVHIRYTYVGLFAWLALAAVGLDRLWGAAKPVVGPVLAAAPVLIVVVAALFSDYAYYTGGMGFRSRWREAFAYVEARRQPGEAVVADYIPHIVGQYYLQDPSVQRVPTRMLRADLDRVGAPMWIVVRAESPTTVGQWTHWLDQAAELRAYFATRVLQPYSAVHVYHFTPEAPADTPAPTAG